MNISKGLLAIGALTVLVSAFPPSLDIGTFTIDDYGGNGGGLPNLSYQIAMGQNFFAGANVNVPPFSSLNASPGLGTTGPTFALDKRNTYVTKAAITSGSNTQGNREYCDFVYYGGHGLSGNLYLGAGANYGAVGPSNLSLGTGYTRWFMAHGCSIFKTATPPADAWQTSFRGLKAMLSFKSLIYDNNLSWDLFNDFWLNWTFREKNLYNSFFDAEANYGYKHLYPTRGLEPGCLSAQVFAGSPDHCSTSFRNVNHDYALAIANSGNYYSRIIGTPQY